MADPAPAVKRDRTRFHVTEDANSFASDARRIRLKLTPAINMTRQPAAAARTPRYRLGKLSITWNLATANPIARSTRPARNQARKVRTLARWSRIRAPSPPPRPREDDRPDKAGTVTGWLKGGSGSRSS